MGAEPGSIIDKLAAEASAAARKQCAQSAAGADRRRGHTSFGTPQSRRETMRRDLAKGNSTNSGSFSGLMAAPSPNKKTLGMYPGRKRPEDKTNASGQQRQAGRVWSHRGKPSDPFTALPTKLSAAVLSHLGARADILAAASCCRSGR
jgi:hypothetical protein